MTGGHAAAGHRSLPHTADVQLEAWGPSLEDCVAECVAGAVGVFAEVGSAQADGTHLFHVETTDAESMLVAVLDELVLLLDTEGRIPVRARLARATSGWQVAWRTVAVSSVPQVGAVPKAVALHDLAVVPRDHGWWCRVTLDV